MNTLQRLEWWFRHSVTYPMFRRLFRNAPVEHPIDLRTIESVLILRYDRFGDMIVTSPIVRQLRSVNPSLHIAIAASEANAPLARHLRGVDEVYTVSGAWSTVLRSIRQARRFHYDVVLNLIFNRTTTGGLFANLMVPRGVKVGQGDPKYSFYFNRLLQIPRGKRHMVNVIDEMFAQTFGESWGIPDLRYELLEDEEAAKRVNHSIRGPSRRNATYIVFNVSSGESRRDPSKDQLLRILKGIQEQTESDIVIVGAPSSTILRDEVAAAGRAGVWTYPATGTTPFMDMVSLIRGATMLISPDTSLVHVASAVGVPVCGLYAADSECAEWSPVGVPYEEVSASPERRVDKIPPESVIEAFVRLLKRTEMGRQGRHTHV